MEEEKHSKKNDEIPVEDIKDILSVINQELPDLIKGLFQALYSVETAEQYAKGIGTIYKTLTEQGLPKEMVESLVEKYADSINIIGKAMQNVKLSKNKEDEED